MPTQNRILSLALTALAAFAALSAWHEPAQAADPSRTVMLVAKRVVQDAMYGSSVIIATPLPGGGHIGFIVNKPTTVNFAQAFPDHKAANSAELLFLGGPAIRDVVFAVVNRHDSPGADALQIAPDLFVATEAGTLEGILEKDAEHARFFLGAVVWKPGELDAEVQAGAWFTLEPDSDLLLRRKTTWLYEDAISRAERLASYI